MRKSLPGRAAVLVGLSLCGLLAGCMSSGRSDVTPATAVRDAALNDIPKPSGYVLVNERSVLRQSGNVRAGQCEYVGRTPRDTLKRFYEEYMPSAGFLLREMSLDRGVYNLRYESEREVCVVRIAEGRGSNTTVTIEIGPRPQGDADRPNAPQRRPRPTP